MRRANADRATDYVWVVSLHAELLDVGLPGNLPTAMFEDEAFWDGNALRDASPNLFPRLSALSHGRATKDRSRMYLAYMFEDDPRLLVVEWVLKGDRQATARVLADDEWIDDWLRSKRELAGTECDFLAG